MTMLAPALAIDLEKEALVENGLFWYSWGDYLELPCLKYYILVLQGYWGAVVVRKEK
jgi:hypothetical protein